MKQKMPLTLTVLPASTQSGRETIRSLLSRDNPPTIRAVYRDISKAPAEFTSNPNFEAVQGDVNDSSTLEFGSSEAVFYIPPPTYDGQNTSEFATKTANTVKSALEKATSVKRLVLFSAMGAQHDSNIGILSLNHITETILCEAAPEVVIIRPGFFMEIWAPSLETLRLDPPFLESWISPLDHAIPMISVADIAAVCAEQLLATGQSQEVKPRVFTLHGPRNYSGNDVKAALEEITGKEIGLVEIEAEKLGEYYGQFVPQPYAGELAEMVRACLPGGVIASNVDEGNGEAVRGKIELKDGLRGIVEAMGL